MTTNSYTIQKREREPNGVKSVAEILAFSEKFASEKNCDVQLSLFSKNENLIENLKFRKLEDLDDEIALKLFKVQNKEIETLNKYVYQDFPVLDNNPEDDKKPSSITYLLKLEIYC